MAKKGKKILYFNYLYDIWGISIGSTVKGIELMEGLSSLGYDVKIYWRNRQPEKNGENGRSTPISFREKVKRRLDKYLHEPNQYLNNLKYLWEENRILKREKPDLLISRLEAYTFSSVLLAKFYRLPILLEVDSPEVYEFMTFHKFYWKQVWLLKLVERLVIRLSDESFTVSKLLKQYFVKRGIHPSKMHIITNGADVNRFMRSDHHTEIARGFNLNQHTVIGFVGSFHYWHGVENLISLINEVLKRTSNVKFLMVGQGGPMLTTFKKFIQDRQLSDQVILTGFVPHDKIPEFVSSMDIVLAPYPQLDFFYYSPVKVYEYMAAGKAVVASRIGQIAEMIRDGYNGFLCRPGDLDEMLEKILTLVQNESLRQTLGRNARQSIAENHTWVHKAKELSVLCEKLLVD